MRHCAVVCVVSYLHCCLSYVSLDIFLIHWFSTSAFRMPPIRKFNPELEEEFVRRKRRYTKSAPTTPKSTPKSTPKPPGPRGFTTEPTIDELIHPDAIYSSYEEFEKAFNVWKRKYQHPFRVASSEALRAQDGSVSEQFRYRYVVFHCARYGKPRVRGKFAKIWKKQTREVFQTLLCAFKLLGLR